MAVKSILNTTTLIQWFGIAFLILLALLILTRAALAILRRQARKQVQRTDLDLISDGLYRVQPEGRTGPDTGPAKSSGLERGGS